MTADACGVLNVLKAPGMSSHAVVNQARRILQLRRIVHTGTLDPLAAGVLVLVVGRSTRASKYFTALPKRYRVEAVFGIRTSSGDADGDVIATRDAEHLSSAQVYSAAQQLTGSISQRPPLTSAVKVGGRRLYELARQGIQVETPLRQVQVHSFKMPSWQPGCRPRAVFDVHCSSGTYIRSLVDSLGEKLGVGATVSFLLRTAVGDFLSDSAATLEELGEARRHGVKHLPIMPIGEALSFLPGVVLESKQVLDVVHGRQIQLQLPSEQMPGPDKPVRLLDARNRLIAIARLRGGQARLSGTAAYDFVLARPEEVVP